MGKGTKMSAEKEAALDKELIIKQKYELLQALIHPRMKHVETVYITENKKYHFSQGHELRVQKQLDPKNAEDSKLIEATGKKVQVVTLPGKYINRSKVVDEISVSDFLLDGEDIVNEYNEFCRKKREDAKKKMATNPDATAELLVDAIKALNEKKAAEAK